MRKQSLARKILFLAVLTLGIWQVSFYQYWDLPQQNLAFVGEQLAGASQNPFVDTVVTDSEGRETQSFDQAGNYNAVSYTHLDVYKRQVLGMVRQLQYFNNDGNYYGIDLEGNPDFIKLAEAYDMAAYRVTKKEEVDRVLEEALHNGKRTLIEFIIPEEETVYPTVPAGAGLDEMILA